MTGRARIFLGDLARALAATGAAGGEQERAVSALLGFDRAVTAGPADGSPPEFPGTVAPVPGPTRPALPEPVAPPGPDLAIGDPVEFDVERSTAPPARLPAAVPPPVERTRGAPVVLRSLLDPLWERGVLAEAVGRQLPEGDVDIPAAIQAIAWGAPLVRVPRLKIQSVSKGCHLLMDHGTGMRPFGADLRQLAAAVRRVVGAEHTRMFTFVDCPTVGVLNAEYEDEPYTPPENGALVLAVSDLCAGGPASAIRRASPGDWLHVARRIRDAGSLLVVLNPYPRAWWPPAAAARVPIVAWDRRTRAADVRLARRGRR